jgi:hypothetical protein
MSDVYSYVLAVVGRLLSSEYGVGILSCSVNFDLFNIYRTIRSTDTFPVRV